jgi:hypothetical protein
MGSRAVRNPSGSEERWIRNDFMGFDSFKSIETRKTLKPFIRAPRDSKALRTFQTVETL